MTTSTSKYKSSLMSARGSSWPARLCFTSSTNCSKASSALAACTLVMEPGWPLLTILKYKLDVRTVTMGIDLQHCAAPDLSTLCDRIRERLVHYSGRLRAVCREVEGRYGIPIVNRRIAVSPIGWVAAGQRTEGLLAIARTLDAVAAEVGVDLVGGFSALVQKGWTEAERRLIASLPEVLSTTERVCASVNVGTTAAGINMDAILALGHVLKETAERTRDHDGFGCAKLVIF